MNISALELKIMKEKFIDNLLIIAIINLLYSNL